ncbi:MAG: alanine racemase [Patescibacteria group bacterium]
MSLTKDLKNGHLRTWIEIKTAAVKNNYDAWRRVISPSVRLMGIVKSNAYGHGLVPFAQLLEKLGVDYLGVDSIVEAVRLREMGIKKDILVLGYTRPDNFASASEQDITLTISTLENWRALSNLKLEKVLKVHLKVDTGMHRQGFLMEDFEQLLKELPTQKSQIIIEGVYSHLAAASNTELKNSVVAQQQEFEKFLDKLDQAGIKRENLIKHLAASGGAMGYPETHYDMVRIGLGMYGYYPSPEWEKNFAAKIKLEPVLTWKTIVGEVKVIPEDGTVGYDCTEAVAAGTKLAVCPIGYWHGYPRALSSLGLARVGGVTVKAVGRISMDMIVLDVTKVPAVKVGDEVTLLGPDVAPATQATLAHTSQYEIITCLNPLVERFYV